MYPSGDSGDKLVDLYIDKMKDVSVCPMLNQGIKDAYEKVLTTFPIVKASRFCTVSNQQRLLQDVGRVHVC